MEKLNTCIAHPKSWTDITDLDPTLGVLDILDILDDFMHDIMLVTSSSPKLDRVLRITLASHIVNTNSIDDLYYNVDDMITYLIWDYNHGENTL